MALNIDRLTRIPIFDAFKSDQSERPSRQLCKKAPVSNEDTDSYYDQHIAPLANEFESKRLEAVRIFRARIRLVSPIVGAAAIVWIVLTINLFGEDALFYCAGGLAFLALAAYGYFKRPLDAYRDEMRQDIYPLIVRSFGESFTYQWSCTWRIHGRYRLRPRIPPRLIGRRPPGT